MPPPSPDSDFILAMRGKAFCYSCCLESQVFTSDPNSRTVLHLDLSNWLSDMQFETLAKEIALYPAISLKLSSISKGNSETINWISKYIGPKLIEVVIEKCDLLEWKDLKKIIATSSEIHSLKFLNTPWVNDQIIEQLTAKCNKEVLSLEFENVNITDLSLFQIGRQCGKLKVLSLVCCTNITDAGLVELAKRAHLSSLHIRHSVTISDRGIEALLRRSSQLSHLILDDCSQITPTSVGSLYENTVAWGKKRNMRAQLLQKLSLQCNPNIDSNLLAMISLSAPALEGLDLRECHQLNLLTGLKHIENLSALQDLRLGPTAVKFDPEDFVESLSFHCEVLKCLHLCEINSLNSDEILAEILNLCLELEEIWISDMNFGQLTVEAICSNIPNVKRLALIGSSKLNDQSMRCLTVVCRHLEELVIRNCGQVTDLGYTRCAHLKLTKLDLSQHAQLEGSLLGCFSLSPLASLNLDSTSLSFISSKTSADGIPVINRMTWITKCALVTLSLQNSVVSIEEVYQILSHFVSLEELNLTGCHHLLPDLRDLWHPHPAVSFVHNKNFLGYRANETDRARLRIFRDIRLQALKENSARKIQRQFRAYKCHLLELLAVDQQTKELTRMYFIVKLQSWFRMMKHKRRYRRHLRAGYLISYAGQKFLQKRDYHKTVAAKTHYRQKLVSKIFCGWRAAAMALKEKLDQILDNRVLPKYHLRLLSRYWRDLILKLSIFRDRKYYECALAIWEDNILRRIFQRWKTVRGETPGRKRLLCQLFLLAVPPERYNSFTQKSNLSMADHFRWMRIITPAWIAFRDDYVRTLKAEQLLPAALKHFRQNFLHRVCSVVFRGLVDYMDMRRAKYQLKQVGDAHLPVYQKQHVLRKFRKHSIFSKRKKSNILSIFEYLKSRPQSAGILAFQTNATLSKLFRRIYPISRRFALKTQFGKWKVGCIRLKKWNRMVAIAVHTSNKKYRRKTIEAWRKYTVDRRNMDVYCWNHYLDRLQGRVFRALHENLEMSREFKRKLEEDLLGKIDVVEEPLPLPNEDGEIDEEALEAARLANEAARLERERLAKEKYEQLIRRIIMLQAISRGFTQRMVFRRFKVAAEWASQVLQNFGRRAIAMKRFRLKVKRWALAERKKQEAELNQMRDEEVETRYFNIHDNAALAIQRSFRGWKGRELASAVAKVYQKERGKKFFDDMHAIRKAYERELRAAAVKELNRHRAATQIQAIVRGRIARKVVRKLRARREIERRVVLIQRVYRGRLARIELGSLRRTAVHMDRYLAARRQRGLVLRLFGWKKRAAQLSVSKILDIIGLEPTSFNYRIHELYRELKEDFFSFVEIIRREQEIYKETKGKHVLVVNARRKYFKMKGVALKRDDACIIIERGHKFYGFTGIVVRVDTSIPGQPLYEVRLDHTPRQTFVHMTTDGLSYYMEQPQPLSRILKYPNSSAYLSHRRPVVYTGSDAPEQSKLRISAAWTIQMAYRRHAARRKVKKRRYEIWIRQADAQRSLMNLLESTNYLTSQAYYLTGKLRLRPLNNILYDEIRHTITSSRLIASKFLSKLGPAIKSETESKYTHRVKYLEKAALVADKNPFLIGWNRITAFKKILFFFRVSAGYVNRSVLKLKDMCGGKGIRQFSKRAGVVTGLNTYTFHDFFASPHVRFPNIQMYQGEWRGLPYFAPLIPYGEGVLIFYDGWGFSREDKVLSLTIICCRHLNATDISSSDPFCEIYCNGKNLQTSVKWSNLNPVWNESFEIDVTNPSAVLNIVVKDKDFIGDDDFLGQILLSLHAFEDGKPHRETYQLKGEDVGAEEAFDRGEIEIVVRWVDRTFDDEIESIHAQREAAIKLQAWARRIAALELSKKYRVELQERDIYLRKIATQITNTCRIRLARKEYKRRLRRYKAAIKIQRRARIRIARKRVNALRRQRNAAIRIQAVARMYNARQLLKRLRAERKKLLYCSARAIQTMVRKKLAIIRVQKLIILRREELINEMIETRKKLKEAAAAEGTPKENTPRSLTKGVSKKNVKTLSKSASKVSMKEITPRETIETPLRVNTFEDDLSVGGISVDSGDLESVDTARKLSFDLPPPPPVFSWINTYGVDPEYFLRRNRRITMRIFQAMLNVKYTRLLTLKYGIVFVNNYPPPLTMEEEINKVSLRNREDFVNAIVPSCVPRYLNREEIIDMYGNVPREGYFHLDAVNKRESVNMLVTMVQCMVRQHLARKQKMYLLRISEAIAKFQRIFRRRNRKQHHAAYLIQSMFHYMRANVKVKHMKLEKTSAIFIQCAFRCWRAKMKELDIRTVRGVRVLKYTPSLPDHGPKSALDCKNYTMWIVDSPSVAEMRVELPLKEAIDAIWIMTSTYEASPKFVSIGVVLDKSKREYLNLYTRIPLPKKRGLRWMKFFFKSKISKYFKITFEGNYGDKSNISIREIRFVRAKEQSATITEQPKNLIFPVGPRIGDIKRVELNVEAEGWPLPKYQWYKNGTLLTGETRPQIMIPLYCPVSTSTRSYRCSSCKNICKQSPKNAYQVICANCGHKFDYKDIAKYFEALKALHELEKKKLKELDKQRETLEQMQSSTDESLKAMLPLMLEQIATLEGIARELRIERYQIKRRMKHVNNFEGEGVYVCAVTNKRGGTVPIKRLTVPVVVVIEHPDRYPLKTIPVYTPRPQKKRKRWTVYSSIKGTFTNGHLQGIVTIRYVGGSYYEGPFIPENALDQNGKVPPSARSPTHWGLFRCPDGRTFEGNNVDNHFDPENIQGNYKVTLPITGEVYEGMIVDEKFHGIGVFHYADGSVYEGEWHVSKRYGHGRLTSVEGWIYEGNFDADMRHGDGIMWWPDGSTYLGHMSHNKQNGQGVYISKVRDIYRGNFVDNLFEGRGEMLYNDGSKYTGDFHLGKRHGIGLFVNRFGTEHFGPFVDDALHGDHVVKKIVEVPGSTSTTPAYEVSLCQYNMGDFVQFVGQSINPSSTKQFIDLFEKDRKAFDGVYAMLITRYLPDAPRGIDISNPEVEKILIKLRTEGGVLTGTDAITEARNEIAKTMPQIKEVREQINRIKKDVEIILKQSRGIEAEKAILTKRFKQGMEVVEEELHKIELYWREDKRERRERFRLALAALDTVPRDDWFHLRNNRVPPPFLKKVMDAISLLLDLPTDWKSEQMLISDYLFNSLNGDEQALRYLYDCKLLQVLKSYNVYEHCQENLEKDSELARILADPRFRRDSYYVESLGAAAPFLVDFVKTNYPYMMAAREILTRVNANDQKRFAAYRIRNNHSKLHIEQTSLHLKLDAYKAKLAEKQEELKNLQKVLGKADETLRYIDESYNLGKKAVKDLDYYEQLEKRIEAKQDRLAVEASLERTLDGVVEKIAKEKLNIRLTMIAQGLEPPEEPDADQIFRERPFIKDWIEEEVQLQHSQYEEEGIGLGYSLDPSVYKEELTVDQLKRTMSDCVENITLRMNDALHEKLGTSTWLMRKGRRITKKFLYVLVWKRWKDEATRKQNEIASAQWEEIWGEVEVCAKMSLQSKLNWRMSELARKQGAIWGSLHPEDILDAEKVLALEFLEQYRMDNPGSTALYFLEDDSGQTTFDDKTKALCYSRLYPSEIRYAQDEKDLLKAKEFASNFPDETALNAFRILNSMCPPQHLDWLEYAKHWRNFFSEEYTKTELNQTTQMANKFKEDHVFHTHIEAAKVSINEIISQCVEDEDTASELYPGLENIYNAKSWGLRNQGMYRSGLKAVELEYASRATRIWNEFKDLTLDFTKGSHFHLTPEMRENPSLDRFQGFRDRLEKKFAWFIGYLYYRQGEYVKILETLKTKDPSERILHNIRPSELKSYEKKLEKEWLTEKADAEKGLSEIIEKIAIWRTYFGTHDANVAEWNQQW